MTFDPYAELGLSRDASPAAVKRAYRDRAKKAHPDGGGSQGDFERLSRANMILSDPACRERYDRTGQADEAGPDNRVSAVIGIVMGFIDAVAMQFAGGQGLDPAKVDLIGFGTKAFQENITGIEKERSMVMKHADVLERVAKRLKKKKKAHQHADLLLRSIQHQAAMMRRRENDLNQVLTNHQEALEIWRGFTFETEMSDRSIYPTSTAGSMFNSSFFKFTETT